jgi:hypothetical protein
MSTSIAMNQIGSIRELTLEEAESASGGVIAVIGAVIAAGTLALGIFSLGCELGKQMAERDNAQ